VILMALNMPEMDGYEATRRLKADGRFAGIPVVALTADVTPDARTEALAAGATAFLSKPVELDEVERYLRRLTGSPEAA
jgi:CheY-like chemotaxis protein